MALQSIDKSSNLPRHAQLRRILADEINRGNWQPNYQIPSEPELCSLFQVSRTVVRQALEDLVNEGKLVRQKGKGTFVARPKTSDNLIQSLSGFYEAAVARGQTLRTQVLRFARIQPAEYVREKLELEEGQDVIALDRLRFIDDEPRSLVVTYLPYHIVSDLLTEDMRHQSLYALLEDKYNLRIVGGHRTVEAIAADSQAAPLLQLVEGDPILLLTSLSYLANGQVIEYFEAQHPGNRSRFEVNLVRERSG